MTNRKFPRGIQRNKVNLVLDNSELDLLENITRNFTLIQGKMKEHVLEQINKARQEAQN